MVANDSLAERLLELLGHTGRDGHDRHPAWLHAENPLLTVCTQQLRELRALAASGGAHDKGHPVVVNLLKDARCMQRGRKFDSGSGGGSHHR